jgi:hypothetical protein
MARRRRRRPIRSRWRSEPRSRSAPSGAIPTGALRWIAVDVRPLSGPGGGAVYGVRGILSDVSAGSAADAGGTPARLCRLRLRRSGLAAPRPALADQRGAGGAGAEHACQGLRVQRQAAAAASLTGEPAH